MVDEQLFKQPSEMSPSEQVTHWTAEVDSLKRLLAGYEVELEASEANEQQDANEALNRAIGCAAMITDLRGDLVTATRELQAAKEALAEHLGGSSGEAASYKSSSDITESPPKDDAADQGRRLSFETAWNETCGEKQGDIVKADANSVKSIGSAHSSHSTWSLVSDQAPQALGDASERSIE